MSRIFLRCLSSPKGTADPSTALRSGRDDHSIAGAKYFLLKLLRAQQTLSSRPERARISYFALFRTLCVSEQLGRIDSEHAARWNPGRHNADQDHCQAHAEHDQRITRRSQRSKTRDHTAGQQSRAEPED
jgi:hypothetical protein